MDLIRTSMLSFLATGIKIISGLIINKVVAVYIGPHGLAMMGQFQNFFQMALLSAQGGINQGIVKYASEYKNDENKLRSLIISGLKINVTASIVVGGAIAVFSSRISGFLLSTDRYGYIIIILGCTLFLAVLNSYWLSILNGLHEIKQYIKINILQSFIGLFFTAVLVYFFKIDGALIALATNQSIIFLYVLWGIKKHRVFGFLRKISSSHTTLKNLAGYSIMSLTSCVCVPLSHMVIRTYIGENIGWDEAGYWQALWYISSSYLMVITTTLSIYYLPKISGIQSKIEIRHEVVKSVMLLLPLAILLSVMIYYLRDFIIQVLFSQEFIELRGLFLFQLIGDVVKISSWVLGILTIAKGMVKEFVLLEIFGSMSFVLLSIFFIREHGLVGVTMAYLVNYVLYLFVLAYMFRRLLFMRA